MAKKRQQKKLDLETAIFLLRQRYSRRLAPPLEGLAYRFTIWLPIQADGKPVFSERQRASLFGLFHDCFGGFSQSSVEGYPPWTGSWLPADADEPIVDNHVLLIIYALQYPDSVTFFRQLKWVLQLDQVATQQVVLIEHVPVHLIEAEELFE